MLKANKDGKLIEYSIKQREHWLAYQYDSNKISWPKLPKRRDTPVPFCEPASKPNAKNL